MRTFVRFTCVGLLCSAFMACGDDPPAGDDDDGADDPTPTQVPGPVDQDGDGYDSDVDCNDNNALVNPGATEQCDGVDNNCNSLTDENFTSIRYYQDSDGDNHGDPLVSITSCAPVTGYVLDFTDCDDTNAAINPDAPEVTCNGIDEDCKPVTDDSPDIDGDGYDTCAPGVAGADANPADCNDSSRSSYPAANEICDDVDNDCDSEVDEGLTQNVYYADSDSDTYGDPNETVEDCGPPPGYSTNDDDCDDTNPDEFPGAPDAPGDGSDSNCNGYNDWLLTMSDPSEPGLAGDGQQISEALFDGPGAIVGDQTYGIYLVDTNNNIVRHVDFDGTVTRIAGSADGIAGFADGTATSALLDHPTALALDSVGNLYIADTGNNRVRKVTRTDGLIATIAGSDVADYTGDGGLARDATLNAPQGLAVTVSEVYVADTGNHVIRIINNITKPGSTPLIDTYAGTGEAGYNGDAETPGMTLFNAPTGLMVDPTGMSLYVADSGNHIIRRIERNVMYRVAGIAEQSGYSGDLGAANSARLDNPTYMTMDKYKNVYFCDTNNNRIRMISFTGMIYTVAGNGSDEGNELEGNSTAVSIIAPLGVMVMDADQNLMVADTGHSWIRKVIW